MCKLNIVSVTYVSIKMRYSNVTFVLNIAMLCFTAEAVKKKLSAGIDVCERKDPELAKCFCMNFNNILPTLNDGMPEMNIVPIDPLSVGAVKMDWSQLEHVSLVAVLQHLTLIGIGNAHARHCEAFMTSSGIQVYYLFHLSKIRLNTKYNAVGHILSMAINATGDFYSELSNINVDVVWNSTRYVKDSKEYLNFTCDIPNMTMEKCHIHFENLFGNNTNLNEDFNNMLNENINILYEEMKPLLFRTMQKVTQQIINNFHEAFPYDVLYPE